MPEDEATFIEKNFPGEFDELVKEYPRGEVVSEMKSYKKKTIYILQGITDNETCTLIPASQADSDYQTTVKVNLRELTPLSEEGICVFNKNKYYPRQMNPNATGHDWSLYLGFEDEKERKDFLANIKDVVRNYRYAERARVSSKLKETYNIESPTAGTLQIYVSEAKNLPIDRFRKELSKNSMKLVDNRLQVRIGFKGPNKPMTDLFTSVFVNESMIDNIEENLKREDICVEHDLVKDPIWSTDTKPAGEMRNIGRLVKLPKTNPLLIFYVCAKVVKNGVQQTCVFGKGE